MLGPSLEIERCHDEEGADFTEGNEGNEGLLKSGVGPESLPDLSKISVFLVSFC